MLRLPNLELPFEVWIDASYKVLGGMLVQEEHLVAFKSWKLDAIEQKYFTHEKEMTMFIHYLETWKYYLMGTKFMVVIDNVDNTFFMT